MRSTSAAEPRALRVGFLQIRVLRARAADDGRLHAQRGSVTAELALLLPGVVLLLGLCLASIQLVAQQVLLQDAAGIAARALGRGQPLPEVMQAIDGRLPDAHFGQRSQGGLICLTLSQPRVLAGVIPITLRATSCAAGAGR